MIEGINRIRGLGVYADYRPAQGMPAFGMKNVIYGWNYSGKTTLSRIFAMIERGRPEAGMPSFEFEFRTHGGVVDQTNYQRSGLQIRVFNADFVAANLNFAGDHFNPIFLLGEESKAAIDKIARCERVLAKIEAADIGIRTVNDRAAADLNNARTAAAAAVRELMSLNAAFRADHLDREIAQVRYNPGAAILTADDLQSDLRLARSSDQDRLPGLTPVSIDTKLRRLREQAEPLLAKAPDLANTIEALAKHPEVERWVLQGLPLHQDQDGCLFCAGPLGAKRTDALRAHFSKDLSIHSDAIAGLLAKVRGAALDFSPRAASELYAPFRDRYRQASRALEDAVSTYNAAVAALHSSLERKTESPRSCIELPVCEGTPWTDVARAIETINAIITEHNRVSNNFDHSKAEAIRRLKAHYAAEFVVVHALDRLDDEKRAREARRGRFHRWSNELKAEEAKQRAIINKAQRGREEINARVESLLGLVSVTIEVADIGGEERFRLMRRDGRPAIHLSEGEKTAIGFAYFMAKLKELPDLAESIVCIDDPISSLDSNHVFQVVGVIREAFFHQVPSGGNLEWRTRCKQLFVLTHNFNFFALLREIKPDKKNPNKARHFLVKRVSPTTSALVDMPAALLNYSSEYHFLFGVLDSFRKKGTVDRMELLLMLPNAMRRFVELYTYARMPTADDVTVDARAEALFGVKTAKRVLKTLHYFSHANNIERMAENNDLMCDIDAAIEEMLSHIEREDPIHWKALAEAHA